MKIAGIIAEYNPFHNGHAYQIHELRRLTGVDHVVVAMSGDFVQRGEPAITDKFVRAKAALSCGADLILELPTVASTASAEYFASAAVALLQSLGCVDLLCFGAECEDLSALVRIADILIEEPECYRTALTHALAQGIAFPAARVQALRLLLSEEDTTLLSSPNNILAVEYLKALKRLEQSGLSVPTPFLIPRRGSGYHHAALDHPFASATALRRSIQRSYISSSVDSDISEERLLSELSPYMPSDALSVLREALHSSPPVCLNDFSSMLHYQLLMSADPDRYCRYFDVPDALAHRIRKLQKDLTDLESFVGLLKTRNLTELTVRRALIHILLQLSPLPAVSPGPSGSTLLPLIFSEILYARVLGFRKEHAAILTRIKKEGHLPLISKTADAQSIIFSYEAYTSSQKEHCWHLFSETRRASAVYHSIAAVQTHAAFTEETLPILLL
ncbi:MAG: nucleotidyltransferase family protein [Eubacteriales bacterium]|nr:nucleotidyltransferase family protein [Eubacteriales bacterium]